MPRLTKSEQRARERLSFYMWKLSEDDEIETALREKIPEAWRVLANDFDVYEKKSKISLRLDDSIAKFFRATGPGFQRRINDILGSYVQMSILKALKDEEFYLERSYRALLANDKAQRLARIRNGTAFPEDYEEDEVDEA